MGLGGFLVCLFVCGRKLRWTVGLERSGERGKEDVASRVRNLESEKGILMH